jgi:putative ABC transport system permease protein
VTQILESVGVALHTIWANKLRSLMTMLGNVVAVGAIVTVVSLIRAMDAMVSDALVTGAGADSFTIQRTPPLRTLDDEVEMRDNPLITLEERDRIRAFGPSIAAVMATAQAAGPVSYRDRELDSVQIRGVTGEYVEFSTYEPERGRLISPVEVDRRRPVALLGWDVADTLFGDTNPIERTIAVAGAHFRVVGVVEKQGTFFGNSRDNFVVIPLGSFQKLFGARQSLELTVKPAAPELRQAAIDDATVALRVHRRLEPTEPDNFGIATSGTLFTIYEQATSGVFAVLIGVVALSLLVGGIVIMNIMLMVVSERTREIGLRKALGARRSHIMSQVLTESVTLSVSGGVVGIVLGFLAASGISAATPLSARLETWSAAVGIGITAGVGLFFGLYPASRAAQLDPIEALRRE